METHVTLHVNEYIWTCPNCERVHLRADVIDPVTCLNCKKEFMVEDVYHTCATPDTDNKFQNSTKGLVEDFSLGELLTLLKTQHDIDVPIMAASLLEDAKAIQNGDADEWEIEEEYILHCTERLGKIIQSLGYTEPEVFYNEYLGLDYNPPNEDEENL